MSNPSLPLCSVLDRVADMADHSCLSVWECVRVCGLELSMTWCCAPRHGGRAAVGHLSATIHFGVAMPGQAVEAEP